MRELFIYYRVHRADAVEAMARVLALQQTLRADVPHLCARLLTTEPAAGERQTWMETYSLAGEHGVDPVLQASIEKRAHALAAFIDGPRHVEVFRVVDRCGPVPD